LALTTCSVTRRTSPRRRSSRPTRFDGGRVLIQTVAGSLDDESESPKRAMAHPRVRLSRDPITLCRCDPDTDRLDRQRACKRLPIALL